MAIIAGPIQTSGYQAPDYSQAIEASLRGGMLQQQITQGAVGQVTDYFKQQGEKKKLLKQSDVQIDAALKLFPDLAPTLQGVRDQIRDENLPLNDRAAIAESVAGLINMGTNQMRFQAEQSLREEQLGISKMQQEASLEAARARQIAAGLKPPAVEEIPVSGGIQKTQWDATTQSWVPIKTTGVGLVDLVKGFEGFNPRAYSDSGQISIGYGTRGKPGEVITEEEAIRRLQAELADSAQRIEDAADLKGITFNKNQFDALVSFDYNTGKGMNLIGRFGDNPEALAAKMREYIKDEPGGEILPGLVKRRGVETALLLTPTEEAVVPTQQTTPVGFAPSKESQGRVMTPEQVQELTSRGFKVSGSPDPSGGLLVTGVQSLAPQKGQETIVNPDGTVTIRDIVTGGKQEGIQKAQEELGQQGVRIIASATENAFSRLDRVGTDNPLLAAGNAILAKALPASETGELQKLFERINGENSFEKMTKLRQSSPTGGAAGSMTEKEWPRFEDRFFNLNVNSRRETQEKGLSLNMLNAFEAANGTPGDIIKAKKEGKITQSQYDGYVTSYMMARDVARIPTDGIPGKSYEWTKLDKDLLRGSTIYESTGVTGGEQMPSLQKIEEIRARRNLR